MKRWKKAYHTNCWGPLGGDAVGVTSVKNLFYRTFGDMRQAIKEIGQAGYQAVEMFDGNLADYEGRVPELKGVLGDSGLTLLAVYSGGNFVFPQILEEELWRMRKAADLGAETGAEHFVVGGGAKRTVPPDEEDYKRLADSLNKVAEIAEERGLVPHYHPHLTTIVETPDQIRKIFGLSKIFFCPDTAHLAAGGGDPPKLILEHARRIRYVHLKDFRRDPFAFLPLGEGELDMNAILQALIAIKYEGWLGIELDTYGDPKAGAEQSMRYLADFENRVQG